MSLLSSESSDAGAKPLPTPSILSYHDLGLPEIMKSIVKKSKVTIFGNCSLYLKQRKTFGPKTAITPIMFWDATKCFLLQYTPR
jgi:hypothetical protein